MSKEQSIAESAEPTEVFTVLVNVKSLIGDVLKANDDVSAGLGNALHRFIAGVGEVSQAAVQIALDEEAKATEDKARKARISELRAVYQAIVHGYKLEQQGYLTAVKESRAFLKEKGILPNGRLKKSPELLLAQKKARFLKKAIDDGVEPENLTAAWEHEVKNQGVAQETVDHLAEDFVNGLLGDGYDHKTIRRILTAARGLLEKPVQPATL